MEQTAAELVTLEAAIAHWIRIVGVAIDVFGVIVIVLGILWATLGFLGRSQRNPYDDYRVRIGRTLLLGLEILVAADIVKTVALEPTFTSLGVLAGLVLVRTFLSWTSCLRSKDAGPGAPPPRGMPGRLNRRRESGARSPPRRRPNRARLAPQW